MEHHRLKQRLNVDFGVQGTALEWLSSYLQDRKQFVKVGDATSPVMEVSTGVPQGSVLGPLLFTAYVSPGARLIDSFGVNHISYADDFTLYINLGNNAEHARRQLSDCSTAVRNWFMFNGLLLNPSKSEALVVGTKAQLRNIGVIDNFTVDIAGVSIKPNSHVKIMGVTLDSSLNFDLHVSNVVSTAAFHLRALKHVRKFVDKCTANTIACSIIGSRLDYCNSVLAGISNHNMKRLQRLQNSAARTVANVSSRTSATNIMRDLHWLPVAQRIDYKIALTTFKLLTTGSPEYLCKLLKVPVPVRVLRSSNHQLLVTPFCKSVLCSHAFSAYAPRLWNNLPQSIHNFVDLDMHTAMVSVDVFKRKLKTVFFKEAYTVAV